MSHHFLVFGTHPLLSLAEAKAVLGGERPITVGPMALFQDTDWNGAWLQERLAGTIKLGDVLFSCSLKELTAEKIVEALPAREGTSKLTFAVTVYGGGTTLKRLPIELKKALREGGRSVRWFADEGGQVSPAAVAKLHLTTEGYDIVVAVEHGTAHVGITTHVQDADAWSLRDYGRPARDARNGMLPPKLARMMVNIGRGSFIGDRLSSDDITHTINDSRSTIAILDPFCGSGTVLMEAALLDQRAKIIGADIDERQVSDTNRNLDWMVKERLISSEQREKTTCFPHDVRTIQQAIHEPVALVVTEGFLGTPLKGHETELHLEREARAITDLWRETLSALAKIQKNGGIVVAIWPILKTSHAEFAVDLTPFLSELGYETVNPLEGWSKTNEALVYARADQRVQRRVIVLRRR